MMRHKRDSRRTTKWNLACLLAIFCLIRLNYGNISFSKYSVIILDCFVTLFSAILDAYIIVLLILVHMSISRHCNLLTFCHDVLPSGCYVANYMHQRTAHVPATFGSSNNMPTYRSIHINFDLTEICLSNQRPRILVSPNLRSDDAEYSTKYPEISNIYRTKTK